MNTNQIKLEGKRILLKTANINDAEPILNFLKDNKDHLEQWTPKVSENYYTIGYWKNQLASWQQEFEHGKAIRFAITLKDDPDTIIGYCYFTQIFLGPFEACYLGYALGKNFTGKGFMYEALEIAIKYVFNIVKLHRIMANYLPTNEASAKLLKKLGFTIEGYAKEYLYINGKWQDHVLSSLINTNSC